MQERYLHGHVMGSDSPPRLSITSESRHASRYTLFIVFDVALIFARYTMTAFAVYHNWRDMVFLTSSPRCGQGWVILIGLCDLWITSVVMIVNLLFSVGLIVGVAGTASFLAAQATLATVAVKVATTSSLSMAITASSMFGARRREVAGVVWSFLAAPLLFFKLCLGSSALSALSAESLSNGVADSCVRVPGVLLAMCLIDLLSFGVQPPAALGAAAWLRNAVERLPRSEIIVAASTPTERFARWSHALPGGSAASLLRFITIAKAMTAQVLPPALAALRSVQEVLPDAALDGPMTVGTAAASLSGGNGAVLPPSEPTAPPQERHERDVEHPLSGRLAGALTQLGQSYRHGTADAGDAPTVEEGAPDVSVVEVRRILALLNDLNAAAITSPAVVAAPEDVFFAAMMSLFELWSQFGCVEQCQACSRLRADSQKAFPLHSFYTLTPQRLTFDSLPIGHRYNTSTGQQRRGTISPRERLRRYVTHEGVSPPPDPVIAATASSAQPPPAHLPTPVTPPRSLPMSSQVAVSHFATRQTPPKSSSLRPAGFTNKATAPLHGPDICPMELPPPQTTPVPPVSHFRPRPPHSVSANGALRPEDTVAAMKLSDETQEPAAAPGLGTAADLEQPAVDSCQGMAPGPSPQMPSFSFAHISGGIAWLDSPYVGAGGSLPIYDRFGNTDMMNALIVHSRSLPNGECLVDIYSLPPAPRLQGSMSEVLEYVRHQPKKTVTCQTSQLLSGSVPAAVEHAIRELSTRAPTEQPDESTGGTKEVSTEKRLRRNSSVRFKSWRISPQSPLHSHLPKQPVDAFLDVPHVQGMPVCQNVTEDKKRLGADDRTAEQTTGEPRTHADGFTFRYVASDNEAGPAPNQCTESHLDSDDSSPLHARPYAKSLSIDSSGRDDRSLRHHVHDDPPPKVTVTMRSSEDMSLGKPPLASVSRQQRIARPRSNTASQAKTGLHTSFLEVPQEHFISQSFSPGTSASNLLNVDSSKRPIRDPGNDESFELGVTLDLDSPPAAAYPLGSHASWAKHCQSSSFISVTSAWKSFIPSNPPVPPRMVLPRSPTLHSNDKH